MVKVVTINEKSGKIELTKEELEKMLNEAYQEGKKENSITSPKGGTLPKGWWDNPYKPSWLYEGTTTGKLLDDAIPCETKEDIPFVTGTETVPERDVKVSYTTTSYSSGNGVKVNRRK